MPTQHIDSNGIFVLSDTGCAVTFWPFTRSIAVHSTEPHPSLPPFAGECEHLHGDGYCEGSSLAGDKLRKLLESPDGSNQVVWDELRRWYDRYFPNND